MPTAIDGLSSLRGGRPSRRRMSTAVTMRPRRLSTPAISGADSGTRVMRSGMKTSCTGEIGRPNSWPPIITVTYSMRFSAATLSFPMILTLRCLDEFDGCFLQRRDQALAIELGDEIMEACLAAALDRRRRRDRGERDDRHMRAARIGADRLGQIEAVHARHLDIGDDRVELLSHFDHGERLIRRADGDHLVTGGFEHRHQHVAEEG